MHTFLKKEKKKMKKLESMTVWGLTKNNQQNSKFELKDLFTTSLRSLHDPH